MSDSPGLDGLNTKQRMFAEEYTVDHNATQAAIRAGYSPKTAYVQGCTLLKNPKIQEHVESCRRQRSERTQITADDVINGLHTEALNENSNASARVTAWSQIGKFLGIAERLEVTGGGGGPMEHSVRVELVKSGESDENDAGEDQDT